MSVYVYSWVWEHAKCEREEMLTLLALADYANPEGECWPNMHTLAKMTRSDIRTIRRHLRSAQERGELEVEPRFDATGFQTSNFYRFAAYRKSRFFGGSPDNLTAPPDNLTAPPRTQLCPAREDTAMSGPEPLVEPSIRTKEKQKAVCAPAAASVVGNGEFKLQSQPAVVLPGRAADMQEVIDFALSHNMTREDGRWFFNKMMGQGWKNDGKPMASWKHTLCAWRDNRIVPSRKEQKAKR